MSAVATTEARAEELRRHYARRHRLGRVVYAAAVLAAFIAAGPFVWSAITALKLNSDLYNADNNPFIFNDPATFDHVAFLFEGTPFPTFVWNTLWVGAGRRHHPGVRPARRLLAGAARPAVGRTDGHRHVLRLPRAAHAAVPVVVAGRGRPRLQDSTWSSW